MSKTRMLYKKDGPQKIDGHMVHYKLFPVDEVDDAINDGWAKTPAEAYDAPKKRGRKAKVKEDGNELD